MGFEDVTVSQDDNDRTDGNELITNMEESVEMVENVLGERLPVARYTNIGSFKDVMEGQLSPAQLNNFGKIWTGKISVEKREDLDKEILSAALSSENLSRYFIKTSFRDCPRCIDGRCICNYAERSEESFEGMRGPQAPGGSVTVAICDRIASWGHEGAFIDEFTLTRDIERIEGIYRDAEMKLGAHGDDHAPEGMTGCGAIDKVPEILGTITSPEAQQQVRLIAKMVLGKDYDPTRVDAILGRLLSLEGSADEYFMKNEEADNYEYRQKAIDAVKERDPENVEILEGEHKEVALVVNLVKDTTFHRDQFAVDHDNIQVFNYDVWWSYEIAEKLHPVDDTMDEFTRFRNKELQARFITARVLFSIGTCMALTDGSLEVIVREPAPMAEAA